MADEQLYLRATSEVDSRGKDPALWAKVAALAEGNTEKARFHYIKLRVAQLKKKNINGDSYSADLRFVENGPANKHIVKIYEFVRSGKSDHEIADIFTKGSVRNLRNNSFTWTQEEIAKIRQDFRLSARSPLLMESSPKIANFSVYSFFSTLVSGGFGLAKSFWLFGIVPLFAAQVLFLPVFAPEGLILYALLVTAYQIPVIMGVWHASGTYSGPAVLAILAKVVMVFWAVSLTLVWLGLLGSFQ